MKKEIKSKDKMKMDENKESKMHENKESTDNEEVEEKITNAGDKEFSDDELDSITNKMIFGSKKK